MISGKKRSRCIYNSGNGSIIFEYPLSFLLSQKSKSTKVKLVMTEIIGHKETAKGKTEIDLSGILVGCSEIERQEYLLKRCYDKFAVICISAKLYDVNQNSVTI